MKRDAILEGAGSFLNALYLVSLAMTVVGYLLFFGACKISVANVGIHLVFSGSVMGILVFGTAVKRLANK